MALAFVITIPVLLAGGLIYSRLADWRAAIVIAVCGAVLYGATGVERYARHQVSQFQQAWNSKDHLKPPRKGGAR
jgi:hypothetical protein